MKWGLCFVALVACLIFAVTALDISKMREIKSVNAVG